MKANVSIQVTADYIAADYRGPDSVEISRSIMRQIVAACEEHQVFSILVTAYLDNSLSTSENYDVYDVFQEVGYTLKHKMAWIDLNPETYESTAFAETILLNRGVRARLFGDLEKAKHWLLSED